MAHVVTQEGETAVEEAEASLQHTADEAVESPQPPAVVVEEPVKKRKNAKQTTGGTSSTALDLQLLGETVQLQAALLPQAPSAQPTEKQLSRKQKKKLKTN
jgi:hypothetical protein